MQPVIPRQATRRFTFNVPMEWPATRSSQVNACHGPATSDHVQNDLLPEPQEQDSGPLNRSPHASVNSGPRVAQGRMAHKARGATAAAGRARSGKPHTHTHTHTPPCLSQAPLPSAEQHSMRRAHPFRDPSSVIRFDANVHRDDDPAR